MYGYRFQMMKVQSPYSMEDGSWSPLLVFITDYALYVAGVQAGGTEYEILCRLPHDELDAIAVSLWSLVYLQCGRRYVLDNTEFRTDIINL